MHYLIALIFISPLYSHSNLGRESLFYPFNSLVWILVILCVFAFFWKNLKNKKICVIKNDFLLLFFIFVILFLGATLSGVGDFYIWLVRLLSVLIGCLFFVSLIQLELNKRSIENLLFILVFAILLQAFIGYVQIFDQENIVYWVTKYGDAIPLGHFQQPNTFASIMATLLIVSIYLVSQPSFKNRHFSLKLFLMISIFSSVFMVISSGSRIGLLAVLVALPLILLARFYFFKKNILIFASVLLFIMLGGAVGSVSNDGIGNTVEKIENFSTEERQDIRVHLYTVSFQAFLDKPLIGHGVGSFQRVFHEYAAEYQLTKGGKSLLGETAFSHPHNELLYWAIEIGALGILAIFTLMYMILSAAYRQGWQSGGAKLAMIVPIALHTQVEHPFYLSAYHYIVFVFLVFVLLYRKRRCEIIKLTRSASVTAQLFLASLLVIVVLYCAFAFNYSKRITLAIFQGGELAELYQIAKHPFFNDLATNLILVSEFEQERESGSTLMSGFYADWLDTKVVNEPNPSYYIQMIDVNVHLGNEEKIKEAARRALYLFPNHPLIMRSISENGIELVN